MTNEPPTVELVESLVDAYKRYPNTMACLAEEGNSTTVQFIIAQKIALDAEGGAPK